MKSSKFQLALVLTVACAGFIFGAEVRAQAQTLTYLSIFNGTDGSNPSAVIQATDGNFYATTAGFGIGPAGLGNLVRITPSGEMTSIYDFCSKPHCADGAVPATPPVLGSDGNLYGVTSGGGSLLNGVGGWGTVYKITLDGELTTLHVFCPVAPCTDGTTPSGIMQAADGNFYGTTFGGGNAYGAGVLFEITPGGNFSVVHTFCSLTNCADGSDPSTPPIQGIDGSLIGTAHTGGTIGGGVVYSISPTGAFNVVHTFFCSGEPCPRGYGPGGVVQDPAGNLFGTTEFGGASEEGTAFEITSMHQFKLLHSFTYGSGTAPGDLILANDGNLYGTTEGINGYGTIFQMTPANVYSTLYHFTYNSGSTVPYTPLVEAPDGNFYGGVEYYGINSNGAEYKFSNNLSPLVRTAPLAGTIGSTVLIVGNGLTGSSSVTFNGVEAAFTVESDTYIKVTVPAGATTGVVAVVTPAGTLNSNPQFVVAK